MVEYGSGTFNGAAATTILCSEGTVYLRARSDVARSSATGGTRCISVAWISLDLAQNSSRSNDGREKNDPPAHMPARTTVARP